MTDEPADVQRWEADVLLKDGRVAQLRPVRPEDAPEFIEFYSRVSEESKYFRFFAPYPTLSASDVARFTTVDHDRRVAFVVTLHSEIIGIGRYDATGSAEAEVAFLVEDAHQGRGVGQLLLEHLAQAGRERGITSFVAEVLPANRRMQQIFREMGYKVDGTLDDGVQRLTFDLDPTDTAIGVMRAREQRAEAASIERIFSARTIAVVGASRRQDSIGQAMVRNLVLGDFSGTVYAVNSTAEAVSGLTAHKTVQDIPGEVDLAIVAVPAESVNDVVLDCAAKGVHGLVVISAGFAEEGEEGRKRQRALLGLSRSYGLRLIGPNCLGIINTDPDLKLNASLSPSMPPQGRVGFFCQSGALGTAILETVSRRGLGLSTFVSAGNRADVSGNDLLQFWQEDDNTEVVLLYLESIGNPRKFSRIARRVSRTKPIVAVKSGGSTQGVPMGHTVTRSSAPQAAVDAMFSQAGVIQVNTLDEMFDVAQLLAHQPLPRGNRVSIVGNSDAVSLIVADAATSSGLVVNERVALGATPTPMTSRWPSSRRWLTRTPTRWWPSTSRRSTTAARRWPTSWRRSASSPTSRSCRRSWAARVCRSCCGCPTWPADRLAAVPCRRTPPRSRRCARWPASSRTPSGGPATTATSTTTSSTASGDARALVRRRARPARPAARSCRPTRSTTCWPATASTC